MQSRRVNGITVSRRSIVPDGIQPIPTRIRGRVTQPAVIDASKARMRTVAGRCNVDRLDCPLSRTAMRRSKNRVEYLNFGGRLGSGRPIGAIDPHPAHAVPGRPDVNDCRPRWRVLGGTRGPGLDSASRALPPQEHAGGHGRGRPARAARASRPVRRQGDSGSAWTSMRYAWLFGPRRSGITEACPARV